MRPAVRNAFVLVVLLLGQTAAASAQDAATSAQDAATSAQDAKVGSASPPAGAQPAQSSSPPGETLTIEQTFTTGSSSTSRVVPTNVSSPDFTGIISPQPSAVVQRSTAGTPTTLSGPLTVKKVYAPMYKQRISDYSEQLQLGVTRGWLSADQSVHFNGELERLRQLEAGCAMQQYSRTCLDELDKQFTLFNIEFSNALQQVPPAKPAPTVPAAGASSSTASPKP